MCTVSIKVNDSLLHRAWANMDDDVDVAEWMQQQIEAILLKMALASERKSQAKSHALQRLWDLAEADPGTISLRDLEGILPAPKTSLDDLRNEYIEVPCHASKTCRLILNSYLCF